MPLPEMGLIAPGFPTNPIPFARRIAALTNVLDGGWSGNITSDEAKANLLILVQMAWGQACVLDTCAEVARLTPILEAADADGAQRAELEQQRLAVQTPMQARRLMPSAPY